jgi:transposase
MLHRHAITDADWDRIKHLLPGQPGQHGGVAQDNRRFIDAVLWVARTGAAWADLPERLGNGNSQWRRFDRWAAKGRWEPILAALRDPDLDVLILDSTAVRAHPCAAGAKKNGTGPGARASRHWAAAAAASGPRSTAVSTASATRSS